MRPALSLLAALLALAAPVSAEVLASSPSGFATRHAVLVAADRSTVYASLVDGVGEWWNADHTVSGNAESLYIDARAMGCFCEVLGPDAGLVHLTVTFVNPGVLLRLSGGLGPLGLMGVAGNLTFEFADREEGTEVVVQYAVGGYEPNGLDTLAPAVDGVLIDAVTRLKRYVEHGSPAGE